MLNFDSVLDTALKNAENLKNSTEISSSTFAPKTQSNRISQSVKTGAFMGKAIGLSLLQKSLVIHKEAEKFENLRLQTFNVDFGIEIQNGKGFNCRPPSKVRVLENWHQIEELINFQRQDYDGIEMEETILMRGLLKDIDFKSILNQDLVPSEIYELCRNVKHCFRKKGETICIQGIKDNKFFIILRGKVQLSVPRQELIARRLEEAAVLKNQLQSGLSNFFNLKSSKTAGNATFITEKHQQEKNSKKNMKEIQQGEPISLKVNKMNELLNSFTEASRKIEKSKQNNQNRIKLDPLNNVDTTGVEKLVQSGIQKLKKVTNSSWKNLNLKQNDEQSEVNLFNILLPTLKSTNSHDEKPQALQVLTKIIETQPLQLLLNQPTDNQKDSDYVSDHDEFGEYKDEICDKDLVLRRSKPKEQDSEIDIEELAIGLDEDGAAQEDFFGQLNAGDYFGQLAIMNGSSKSMTGWCIQNTHFLYIPKYAIDKVLNMVQSRFKQDRINFLKFLPVFNHLSQTKVRQMTELFKPVSMIRGSYLFKENDPASHVFIVQSGQFKISKKVQREKQSFDLNTELIIKDPLKVKRQTQEFDLKNSSTQVQVYNLEMSNERQFLGLEDIVNLNNRYSMTVKCEQSGDLIAITKSDFMKLKSNDQVWKELKQMVKEKIDKFGQKIVMNHIAELQVVDTMQKQINTQNSKDRQKLSFEFAFQKLQVQLQNKNITLLQKDDFELVECNQQSHARKLMPEIYLAKNLQQQSDELIKPVDYLKTIQTQDSNSLKQLIPLKRKSKMLDPLPLSNQYFKNISPIRRNSVEICSTSTLLNSKLAQTIELPLRMNKNIAYSSYVSNNNLPSNHSYNSGFNFERNRYSNTSDMRRSLKQCSISIVEQSPNLKKVNVKKSTQLVRQASLFWSRQKLSQINF